MGGGTDAAAGVLTVFLPRRALRSILGLLSDMGLVEPLDTRKDPVFGYGGPAH